MQLACIDANFTLPSATASPTTLVVTIVVGIVGIVALLLIFILIIVVVICMKRRCLLQKRTASDPYLAQLQRNR